MNLLVLSFLSFLTFLSLPLHAQQSPADDYQTQARVPADMKIVAQAATDFFAEKKFDEAARCYKRMIEKYPRLLYAWSNIGVVYYQLHDLESAEAALEYAVKLAPNDVFSLKLLGIVLMDQGKDEEAVDLLRRAYKLAPQDTALALRLATALNNLHRDDEVRAVLKQAQQAAEKGSAAQRGAAQQ